MDDSCSSAAAAGQVMMCPSWRSHCQLAFAFLSLLLVGSVTSPAAAQVLRGRVIDASTRNAVMGAYVLLIDPSGVRLNGVLTNNIGVYNLAVPQAGRYLVRAEMIGRQSVDSRSLDLLTTDTLTIDLTLPLAPIALDVIDVSAARKCEVRPGAGGETHTVWEETRKALTLEAVTRAGKAYRFNIEKFERELDNGRTVVSERTQHISRYTGDPFTAKPAGHLADLGYHEERPDGHFLYGPNAEVLLSDPFLDTHCMFLRRDRDKPGLIALAFEPVPGRRVTDIRGELWLDEQTAELRSLEFRYTNLPGSMPRGDYGGEASFQRLPSGAWIVRNWGIRSPIIRLVQSSLRGQQIRNEEQTGFYVEGAEVLLIQDRAGNVVDETPRAVLAGLVWDSIGGAPLPGAVVYLVDTDFADTTDTAGRFRLTGLPEGTYSASWRNAITESRGYRPDPRTVELRRGEVSETEFSLTRDAFRNLTAAEAARLDSIVALGKALGQFDWAANLERATDRGVPDPTGAPGQIRGEVVEHETGRGIQGVEITIRGTDHTAVTGLDGKFVIRGVPPGEYEILTRHAAYGTQSNRLTLHAGELLDVSLRLVQRGTEIRPIAPTSAPAQRVAAGARDPARIFGTVLSGENGKAVSGVIVSIAGTELRRQTDDNGRFDFVDVPAGSIELKTEHLGFSPLAHRVELGPGRSYDAVLRLVPQAIPLDPLTVNVTVEERSPWLEMQGFYDRKLYGGLSGHFLTRSDIEKRDPTILTDLYDDLPGVRSFWIQPGQRTVRFRRVTTITLSQPGQQGYGCEPDYYLDGLRYKDPMETRAVSAMVADFNALSVNEVGAIEVYVGAAMPIQYQGTTNCGVILVWTRRGRG